MLRLVLAGVVIVLIAAACGGGGEGEGSPTSTVAQDGSGRSELTVAEYAAWCAKIGKEEVADPETWGEAAQQAAKVLDDLEDVTPPEELKAFHSAWVAFFKGSHDFYRSEDAKKPYDEEELSAMTDVELAELAALRHDLLATPIDGFLIALSAIDQETVSQLQDAGCNLHQ